MSLQTWNECVAAAIADATPIANTSTETAIYQQTIPANWAYQGRTLRLRSCGKLSTTATPTIQFALRWGGSTGVLLAQSAAITNGSGVANQIWGIVLIMVFRSIGATGTALAFGEVIVTTSASAQVSSVFSVAGATAPAVATIDTTIDKVLALTATWSAPSASNTLTGMYFTLEAMN